MSTNPTISVVMITYGHENYIRQAIEGVLMQECNFEIELVISNDCSPDKTHDIIQDILKSNNKAKWIKYFNHEKNLGMMPNFIFTIEKCKSKYIALCEGDDYWIDPKKLQKQVDFLEKNLDYILCFHKAQILKTDGQIVEDFITKVPDNYEKLETLAQYGNYIHTPTVVFRNIIKKFPFEFELAPIGDFFLYLILAQNGKLKYIDQKMAVYRHNVGFFSIKNCERMVLTGKLYTSILSYFNDDKIKKIIFDRYLHHIDNLNISARSFYSSNNFIAKNKSYKDFIKSLIKKIFKYRLNT